MKLTKKLLTVLPIATISVITPIVVSGCSCSSSYEIKYGDSINCKNKDDKNVTYHSIDDVKNASRNHVQVAEKAPSEYGLTWENAINNLKEYNNSEMLQQFYWDLIYSASNEKIEFTLVWDIKRDSTQKTVTQNINFNGTTCNGFEYKPEGNDFYIYSGDAKLVKSFTFSQPK